MRHNIAILGECMIELSGDQASYRQSFAGDTLNTAIYLSRLLGDSAQIAYVTGVGKDDLSQEMVAYWQMEKLDTSAVFTVPNKQPGLYLIKTDENGERRFLYWRNDAAARYWLANLTVTDVVRTLSAYQYLYLSGISLAILPVADRQKLFAAIEQLSAKVIFDNNYRPALWENIEAAQTAYRQVLSLTETAFLTFEDEQALFGFSEYQQAIAQARQFGVKEVVVKRGKAPCVIATATTRHAVAAINVEKVVDTTAAGDAFSAGYLAKRLQGGTAVEAAQAGHKLASTVIQYKGAIVPITAMPLL